MKISNDEKKIEELLSRGVEDIHVRENLEKKLHSGKPLRIKHGIDPTGEKIHLGRAATLWKVREFQDLGHKVILIIGDYTAQIGDPSDKLSKRPFLSAQQVKRNMAFYKEQIGKIIDLKKVEWRYNSEWLEKLTLREIDELAEHFTAAQMLARRNFKERWERKEDISIREFHYPLYQGYDSVAIKADVEIGGFDQLFNVMAGRKIQEAYGQAPQDILTGKMLLGLDGRKMSTSWGNVITIVDEPADMYGKLMSMNDKLIPDYALLCARMSVQAVYNIEKELKAGSNPRDLKMRLAFEIVKLYHGEVEAKKAQEQFVKTFQKHEAPSEVAGVRLQVSEIGIVNLLVKAKLAESKSEARRVVEQGGVQVDGKVIKDRSEERRVGKECRSRWSPYH